MRAASAKSRSRSRRLDLSFIHIQVLQRSPVLENVLAQNLLHATVTLPFPAQVLWGVAQLGSFERAATALGLKENTVRRYISRLEDRLGVKLFKESVSLPLARLSHWLSSPCPPLHLPQLLLHPSQLLLHPPSSSMTTPLNLRRPPAAARKPKHRRTEGTLSDAGTAMVYYVEQTLLLAHDACQALTDLGDLKIGSLSVGVSQAARAVLLPALVDRFLLVHPSVSIDLMVADTPEVCTAVATGRVDCGLVGGEVPRSAKEVLHVRLSPLHLFSSLCPPSFLPLSLESSSSPASSASADPPSCFLRRSDKCVAVAREELILVVAASHPLALSSAPLQLEDMYTLDFCVYSVGSGW